MSTITEGQHAGEFLLSEAPGTLSREQGTLKSGEVAADGEILSIDAGSGKLVVNDGTLDTDGNLAVAAEGVMIGDADASDADVEVGYIARLAEVRDSSMSYPDEASEGETAVKDAVVASLAEKNIIPR